MHRKYLIISIISLEILPDSIGDLKNLTELNLRANRLAVIPETIGDIKSLRFLDLRDNRLNSLPESIRFISQRENPYPPNLER